MPIVFARPSDKVVLERCLKSVEEMFINISARRMIIKDLVPASSISDKRALMPFHCLNICISHLRAGLDAVKAGNVNTPGALLRCTFEAYARGVWLFYVKDEQLLKNFEDGKGREIEKVMNDLKKTSAPKELYENLSDSYMNSKSSLNALVHNAFESVHWQADYIGADVKTVSEILGYLLNMCFEALAAMVVVTRLDEINPDLASAIIGWKNSASKELQATQLRGWTTSKSRSARGKTYEGLDQV